MNMPVRTPAFIYDEGQIRHAAEQAAAAVRDDATRLLFAMKSFSIVGGLQQIAPLVDGFAASSLFEARLGREVLGERGTVHLTSPGLREDELAQLVEVCDYISLNSLPQWQRFRDRLQGRVSCGLRVNPELSFVEDPRYDPCRPGSKLGMPLSALRELLDRAPQELDGIEGLHIHSNCDAEDFTQLLQTVQQLEAGAGKLLARVQWLNLGGGYLFDEAQHLEALATVKAGLQERYALRVFIEPGAAIIRQAGTFVASVVDLFASGGLQVAVLDTTVNHMPEVFEYQFRPDVAGDDDNAPHAYLLAGSSCLAGDVFGTYHFAEPLAVGSRLVFTDMGAYSMVKANMFNGINLPDIHARTPAGELVLCRRYEYRDFLAHCGADEHAGL